jgi:transcriptional regulator with GAF, ATPase, and Fis domain
MAPTTQRDGARLQAAVRGVARAIADSLELKDVWDRVAEACRTVVPFDGMGVSRLQGDGRVRAMAAMGIPASATMVDRFFERSAFSPRFWPDADDYLVLITDTLTDLDRSFGVDRDVIERGYRSALRIPLGRGQGRAGSLILTSTTPGRFTKEHGQALQVVGEMVALALAHEDLAARRRERRRRRDALDRLVPALTGTLDVRAVFDQLAGIAQEIIPHDFLTLGLLTGDGKRVRIHAKWGDDGVDVDDIPEIPLQEALLHTVNWDYFLAREWEPLGGKRVRLRVANRPPLPDAVHELELDDFWNGVFTEGGVRSSLRATVRRDGQAIGGIEFGSRRKNAFDDEDGEFAMRIAEHVALALAHQRLAEEARRAVEAQDRATRLEERVQALVEELEARTRHRARGRSAKWRDVLAQATKVALADTTVLITGESGTGKEVLARFIHRGSARKEGPFVALNCAALPETLLESELFGHEKGAFTGAVATRAGQIEQAEGGVLFLDEVGEMSLGVQAKLLRVLQEREYQRVGGVRTLKADIRVLAATNRDLKAAIGTGTFREDLYYRLAVFEIDIPPLRERPDDVLVLADAFLQEIGATIGRPAAGVSADARERLVAHRWPGNVRELRNALERATILCEGGLITSEHLPLGMASARPAARVAPPGPASAGMPVGAATATLEEKERAMIADALARAGHNKSEAARLLGLTRAQLRSRLDKHKRS